MAKRQMWIYDSDGIHHIIIYKPRGLFSRAKISIDGSTYPLYAAKLLGASQESFMIAGEMAYISIGKGKRASVIVSGEIIPETK